MLRAFDLDLQPFSLFPFSDPPRPSIKQSAYVLGTDPTNCDVCLPAMTAGEDQQHYQAAAIVHHSDGRTFLIALCPTVAVSLDGAPPLPLHKPTALRRGSSLSFGAPGGGSSSTVSAASFTFEREEGGDGAAPAYPAAAAAAARAERAAAAAARASGPSSVRASHLLVKHAGSRRPSSWKEPVVTRSLGEARAAVSAFREQVERSAAGAPSGLAAAFASLAAAESHCSSARSGGDLGVFGRGQMQRVFEEAAFGLGVGEMSGLVESDSGRKKERESVFSFFLSLSSTFSRFET